MTRRSIVLCLALSLLMGIQAIAQNTPNDVRDLIGARAAGGQQALRNRGYTFVKASEGDGRKWANYWNSRTNVCITVATVDGRYESIVDSPAFDCNRGGNSGGSGNQGGFVRPGNVADAISSCQTEARYRLNSDLGGGRGASLTFDGRPSTGQASAVKISVNGTGRFAPGGGVRSRPFKYTCVYSAQSRQVSSLNYEFVDPNLGADYRPGPSYSNSGRIWYSGAIINQNSGKGLDVTNRSNQNAANIQQWSFADQDNQKWDVIDLGGGQYSIINHQSNKAMDVAGGYERDGGNIEQYRWNGGDNQRWYLRRKSGGYYEIVNVHSGKCLDVENRSKQDGANIQQWSCSGGSNQAWKFGR